MMKNLDIVSGNLKHEQFFSPEDPCFLNKTGLAVTRVINASAMSTTTQSLIAQTESFSDLKVVIIYLYLLFILDATGFQSFGR